MSKLLSVLLGLVLLGLLASQVSCTRDAWHAPMVAGNDTLPLLPAVVQAKKITITGPVNFITQAGTGNVATPTATDNTKAGQRATSAAIGAGSTATTTTPGTPWFVYALLVVLLLGTGFWLHTQFPFNPF